MSTKKTIFFSCPCEKEHAFEETFLIQDGPGSTTVQVCCPHPQCPAKNPLLSFAVPYVLKSDGAVIKGISDHLKS